MERLKNLLRQLVDQSEKSKAQIAKETGITPVYLNQLLSPKYEKLISVEKLNLLGNALGLKPPQIKELVSVREEINRSRKSQASKPSSPKDQAPTLSQPSLPAKQTISRDDAIKQIEDKIFSIPADRVKFMNSGFKGWTSTSDEELRLFYCHYILGTTNYSSVSITKKKPANRDQIIQALVIDYTNQLKLSSDSRLEELAYEVLDIPVFIASPKPPIEMDEDDIDDAIDEASNFREVPEDDGVYEDEDEEDLEDEEYEDEEYEDEEYEDEEYEDEEYEDEEEDAPYEDSYDPDSDDPESVDDYLKRMEKLGMVPGKKGLMPGSSVGDVIEGITDFVIPKKKPKSVAEQKESYLNDLAKLEQHNNSVGFMQSSGPKKDFDKMIKNSAATQRRLKYGINKVG